ncbi:MAG: glycosyltransferase family 2 protein [Bacteroidota bacterium]|nr:glycosyltransferase family 2 protein [Bacteroidota bacterium]
MPKISAAIITYNEEKNIERCLSSLSTIADEIIVVDSYSDDQTEAICKKYNVKFVQHPFEGYSQQKNYALSNASFDVVLSLDADEALSEKLAASIKNIKSDFRKQGYYFNRKTNFCGQWIKYSGWYPDRKLRLVNRLHGEWGGSNPHEKFIMHEGDAATGFLEGDLLHYSYYKIDEFYKKSYQYAELAAKDLFKKGRTCNYLNLWVHTIFKFVQTYFLKWGFLDGINGFQIAKISTQATFHKYQMLRYLHYSSN